MPAASSQSAEGPLVKSVKRVVPSAGSAGHSVKMLVWVSIEEVEDRGTFLERIAVCESLCCDLVEGGEESGGDCDGGTHGCSSLCFTIDCSWLFVKYVS